MIEVRWIDMWECFKAKTVEKILPVVFLPVKGPGYPAVLLCVTVEELDGHFPT